MQMKSNEVIEFMDFEEVDLLLYVINRAHIQVKYANSRIRDISNNISYCEVSKRMMRKKYNGFKLEVEEMSNERKEDNR